MNFDKLSKHIPLPLGVKRNFGILIPLVCINNEWHLLFEERAHTLRSQPGEICFPGGGIEGNESAKHAAIREACEELGITKDQVRMIGPTDFMVTPFNYCLYPFVAELCIKDLVDCRPNAAEVERLFTVPLDFFLRHEPEKHTMVTKYEVGKNFPFNKIQNGESYNWKTGSYDIFFYDYHGTIIWGMTAKLIENFVTLVNSDRV